MKSLRNLNFKNNRNNTVEVLVSGHPPGVKKVSKTGAVRFRECKITEFVWELRKMGFCKGGRLRERYIVELPLYHDYRDSNCLNE